jgi:hypothetical protein
MNDSMSARRVHHVTLAPYIGRLQQRTQAFESLDELLVIVRAHDTTTARERQRLDHHWKPRRAREGVRVALERHDPIRRASAAPRSATRRGSRACCDSPPPHAADCRATRTRRQSAREQRRTVADGKHPVRR